MRKLRAAQRFSLVLAIGVLGCSSSAKMTRELPSWIHFPARTVDNGFIVYVSSAEDLIQEQALFRAKSQAIEDIANECSFVPVGTRLEDEIKERTQAGYEAFVKIGVSFQDCEAAQQATDPNQIKRLANVSITEQLKKYQEGIEAGAEQERGGAPTAEEEASSTAIPDPSTKYFIVRQQLVYAKEVVILAPDGAYPPSAIQTTRFVERIQPLTREVQTFQLTAPEAKTWSRTWSTLGFHPKVTALTGIEKMRSSRAYTGKSSLRAGIKRPPEVFGRNNNRYLKKRSRGIGKFYSFKNARKKRFRR